MLQKTNASLFFAGFAEQKLGGHGRSRIYGAKICETSQINLVKVHKESLRTTSQHLLSVT